VILFWLSNLPKSCAEHITFVILLPKNDLALA
jgi:hypothetical protein